MQALLLYPPITDSTSPYHSLVYLASFARAAGFRDIAIRDTNIEALNFCAQPEVVAEMTAVRRARRRALGARPSLSGAEQLEYFQLTRAEAVTAESITAAIATMRDRVRFYDYEAYGHAASSMSLWLEILSCAGWPGQFEPGGHSLRRSGWLSLSSIADLTNEALLTRLIGPFLPYFESVLFPQVAAQAPAVIGINVTYTSQLPYALWLARRLRRLLPDTFIVCGGTEVSGVWKYLRDREQMTRLFAGIDACVVGEGETAFVRILEEVLERRPPAPIENVVRFGRDGDMTPPPGIRYENLEALPPPDYSLMDSTPYFSPHPLIYYSPTRGCYWNKCTFCDYGLNFGTPTSPWRQISVERSIAHLRAIAVEYRHIYLSVDVLAPGRLLQLAEAIVESGIDIRWAAEIRLERFFTAERCRVLRRSGCAAVSVGFEAGSQRILDLIDKGVTLPDVETTIRNFSAAGIAVQMMGFTGFPSETLDEALASVAFLNRTRAFWNTSALGEFLLTPGAIVARKAGIAAGALEGDDIVRSLRLADTPPDADREALRAAKRGLSGADFDRPFAGGIDAAHSIFYYDRYGRDFPRGVADTATADTDDEDVSFLLAPNAAALAQEYFDTLRLPALGEAGRAGERAASAGRALDHAAFTTAMAALAPLPRASAPRPFIVRADGVVLPCPESLIRLLRALEGGCCFTDFTALIAALNEFARAELIAYASALTQSSLSAHPRGSAAAILSALLQARILRRMSRNSAPPLKVPLADPRPVQPGA